MKIIMTKELLKVMRRREVKYLIFNFNEHIIRISSDEKLITGNTVSTYYHIKTTEPSYGKESGMWVLGFYSDGVVSTFLSSLREGDEVDFKIVPNSTTGLEESGFNWEFLSASYYRGKKSDKHVYHLDQCISKAWIPSNDSQIWNEIRLDQYVTY